MVDHHPADLHGHGAHRRSRCSSKYGITREDADQFAYRSHQNALRAQAEGKFDDEIVPVEVETTVLDNGKPQHQSAMFTKDEGPRADTSLEALAKLKPVFQCRRHGHGRQFLADQRRRGGGDRHVGQESARSSG